MIVEKSNLELRENRALDYFQNIVETVRERSWSSILSCVCRARADPFTGPIIF